jgi:Holliday junction resolvasome RuvABC DNA-binding subunit
MKNRLAKLLGINAAEAQALADHIEDKLNAVTDESLSKKQKLKHVLKDLGWSKKEISHFVYGPPKKKTPAEPSTDYAQNTYDSKGAPAVEGGKTD